MASRQQTESKLAANNRSRAALLTLQQGADSAKEIYETYLTRASQLSAARTLQQADATVESRAIALPASAFSSTRFILAVASVLGAIAGLLAMFVPEMTNRRIRSRNDLIGVTGVPVAGILPDVRALRRARGPAGYIVNRPLTAYAEAFRNLRAYLAVPMSRDQSQIIAVTSAVPGEGKTMTSICLARTFAATGSQVVLVDCDLRRASASRYFPKAKFGVAEVVQQSIPLEDALVHDGKSGIWFLAAGATRHVSGDLFVGDRIDELLRKLAERFDVVVIDTAPLLGFADARILASKADCVLHVVQWDKTPAAMVRAAAEILRQCHARVVGAVLNKVNMRRQARYGFADGSDYYHHYGSSYAKGHLKSLLGR
jgi:capsular exopolysaccharide synthesis family protein